MSVFPLPSPPPKYLGTVVNLADHTKIYNLLKLLQVNRPSWPGSGGSLWIQNISSATIYIGDANLVVATPDYGYRLLAGDAVLYPPEGAAGQAPTGAIFVAPGADNSQIAVQHLT